MGGGVERDRRVRVGRQDHGGDWNGRGGVRGRLEQVEAGPGGEKGGVAWRQRRDRLLALHEVGGGSATSALLHPREVFRHALKHAASAAIVAHHHPSGDPTPRPADRAVTRQLADAGRVVGVELLDHVVVGRPEADPAGKGRFSCGEAGLI